MDIEELANQLDLIFDGDDNHAAILEADGILEEYLMDADGNAYGASKAILEIWKNSEDRASTEEVFRAITGRPLEDFFGDCIDRIE